MKGKLLSIVLLGYGSLSYAQLNPFTAGTINPGDSIVIYYDVTINNPCGCTQISNQGNISGSNFSAIATDDPKTGTLNDATVTLLNMFPLPVTLLEFGGIQVNAAIRLGWKTYEMNVHHFELEKSKTSVSFNRIASLASLGNGTHDYSYLDSNQINGGNYYRLKTIDLDGKITYSPVVRILTGDKSESITVFPNPVTGKTVTLQFYNLPQDVYHISVYNAVGQVKQMMSVFHSGGSSFLNLNLSESVKEGLYTLVVQRGNNIFTQKLIVQ